MRFRFPKVEKLKHEKQIQELFEKGDSITSFPLKLIYLASDNKRARFCVGFTVPKRNFKSAVQRNRIKRLLREGYRLNKHLIFNKTEGSYAFIFLYLGKEIPSFQEVEDHIITILNKFIIRETHEEVDT
jgi:ribonuclease P protein component